MSAFSAIDLEKLPSPEVVETLSVEDILSAMTTQLKTVWPEFDETLESDPALKLLEIAAYRELLLRARINDASRALMLAFAQRADLEHIAAQFGVERQVEVPGNTQVVPPIDPIYESDARLRLRTQLSLEGHTTAGSIGSYVFHALAADARVKDVNVASPSPGEVEITVLSTLDRGEAPDDLLALVDQYLSAEDVRPLTDYLVAVNSAEIIEYRVSATIVLFDGPDSDVVLASADQALLDYVSERHTLGHDIAVSGIYAALHQTGVQRVVLNEPVSDVVIEAHQAGWNTQIDITVGGRDE